MSYDNKNSIFCGEAFFYVLQEISGQLANNTNTSIGDKLRLLEKIMQEASVPADEIVWFKITLVSNQEAGHNEFFDELYNLCDSALDDFAIDDYSLQWFTAFKDVYFAGGAYGKYYDAFVSVLTAMQRSRKR